MGTETVLERVLKVMAAEGMLPGEGALLLAAVSGGMDSMVLLDVLDQLGRRMGFRVAAAHFNHHLRAAAGDDEDFVRTWAQERAIPFYSGGADVAALCRQEGLSLEEGARKARYAWLESLCRQSGAVSVATAHHRADQAETILLNLVRGSGMEGMRGIAARRDFVIRPFLTLSREEIAAYARERKIPHVEDESNSDLRFARNRVRHEVMPQLHKINPRAEAALCRAGELMAEEDRWLTEEMARRMPEVISLERGVAVAYAAFFALDSVLRRRGVRLLLERLEAGKKDITASQLCQAAELKKGKSLTLPGGILVSVRDGLFRLEMQEKQPDAVVLPREGEQRWGEWYFTCRTTKKKETLENTLVFSLDKIKGPVTVSCWDPKGRMDTGCGSRSLKRLFSDAALGVGERERVPVLYDNGMPIAAAGVAADPSFAEGNGPWWVVTVKDEKE